MTKCLILLLLLSSCASIPRQPWTAADKAMFGAACAANAYDCYTTAGYINDGGRMRSEWQWLYHEDTPSSGTLAVSKAAQLGLGWIVLDRVPSTWCKVGLAIMMGGWVWYGSKN